MSIRPFTPVERAVREVIETSYGPAVGHTGGDLSYKGENLYVFISMVPGSGSTDQINGEWAIDIDCFSPTWIEAMTHALALEALLLPGRHRAEGMILDSVYQNEAPAERPWEDDAVARIGATYVFTARRSG